MKHYLIYNGRYLVNEERATVLETCLTEKEGLQDLKDWAEGSVLVEYDSNTETDRIIKIKEEEKKFKCRNCGLKYKNSFCSTNDIGICRWCSGEEK